MTTSLSYQIKSALFGLCVGDALGVPVEFLSRHSFQQVTTMVGYGTHNKPPGTWSDDSSMTFCTVESLCKGFDLEDMKQNFCNWIYEGHWTHDGHAFDIGITTSNVLARIKAGTSERESGEKDEYSNGNGSLMRILPFAFYAAHLPHKERFSHIEEASGITHAHIRSKIACSIYIEFAINLLQGETVLEAYQHMKPVIIEHYFKHQNEDELAHFKRVLLEDIFTLKSTEIASSGYVVSTLEAALWCTLTTNSYREAVLKAVNLGDDTDTVGAVTGGLAGILYGFDHIPIHWINTISRKDDIIQLCDQFASSLS